MDRYYAQVKRQAAKFDDIIIDAGGRDSSALRAALVLSDVLLVPFHPRSYDVWALNNIAILVDEARSVRDGLRAVANLNCADPGESSSDNLEAAAAVSDVPQFEYLATPIRRHKVFCQCRWRRVVRAGTKTDGQEGGGRVKCTCCRIVLILKQYR
ncbi:MAG TPA: hypothetical protein PL140_08785 [Ferrovaceae bacterium]|nr:hypothetical protein [Ferrovaceae bacterium]